jgi:3-dehydroquinate synthetase
VAAARLSRELTGLSEKESARILELFRRAALPTEVKLTNRQWPKLFAAMKLDKKVSNGEMKFVLAQRLGKVVWGQRVPTTEIEKVLTADER